ncbi:glutathione S-transferase-like isoform 1-T1 [Cyanocitta cristata]
MSGKPKLHYFNGRGRMEPIRWLLAAAGVEFEESYLEKKEDLTKLQQDGSLLFQQVPMVEIDGMKLVQTRAIANYIATKYNLYGKDLKERALIDMYVEGMFDLNELLKSCVFQPADKKEQHFTNMMDKATNRYFPVFEKVLKEHGKDFLVGNQLSRADVQLLEIILMAEEFKPDILAKFPLLQFWFCFVELQSKNKQYPHNKEIPAAWQPEKTTNTRGRCIQNAENFPLLSSTLKPQKVNFIVFADNEKLMKTLKTKVLDLSFLSYRTGFSPLQTLQGKAA